MREAAFSIVGGGAAPLSALRSGSSLRTRSVTSGGGKRLRNYACPAPPRTGPGARSGLLPSRLRRGVTGRRPREPSAARPPDRSELHLVVTGAMVMSLEAGQCPETGGSSPRGTAMLPGMVATRPVLRVPRSRSRSAGPLRICVLAALLLAVMYTHGVSGESAAGHAHPGAFSLAALHTEESAAGEHSHDGPGSHLDELSGNREDAPAPDHAAHQCVSGQPEQGALLAAPCESPLEAIRPPHSYGETAVQPAGVPWTSPPFPDFTVLRI